MLPDSRKGKYFHQAFKNQIISTVLDLKVVHFFYWQSNICCSSFYFFDGFSDCMLGSKPCCLLHVILNIKLITSAFVINGSTDNLNTFQICRLACSSKRVNKSKSWNMAISWNALMKLEDLVILGFVVFSYSTYSQTIWFITPIECFLWLLFGNKLPQLNWKHNYHHPS